MSAKHLPGLSDEAAEIRRALRQPIESAALSDCVHSERIKWLVIVTDNTRACPDDRLVPLILEELAPKIPNRDVTILVAHWDCTRR